MYDTIYQDLLYIWYHTVRTQNRLSPCDKHWISTVDCFGRDIFQCTMYMSMKTTVRWNDVFIIHNKCWLESLILPLDGDEHNI